MILMHWFAWSQTVSDIRRLKILFFSSSFSDPDSHSDDPDLRALRKELVISSPLCRMSMMNLMDWQLVLSSSLLSPGS